MNLDPRQLESAPKKIGVLKGMPVYYTKTKGGRHFITSIQEDGDKTLAFAPHKAIALHVAERMAPEIVWTELSKSDHCDYDTVAPYVDKYVELTKQIREVRGE